MQQQEEYFSGLLPLSKEPTSPTLNFSWQSNSDFAAPLNLLGPSTCICGSNLDNHGNHLKCRIGNEWHQRHSSMVHLIASIMKSTEYTVQHEVSLLNLGPLRSLNREGSGVMDLVVTSSDSQTLLADVTITHPIPTNPTSITEPMLLPLHFARLQENRKFRRYGEVSRQMHHKFLPFAFETFGASGPAFDRFLKRLATRHQQNVAWHTDNDLTTRSLLIR